MSRRTQETKRGKKIVKKHDDKMRPMHLLSIGPLKENEYKDLPPSMRKCGTNDGRKYDISDEENNTTDVFIQCCNLTYN